jgi:hypothetical protein
MTFPARKPRAYPFTGKEICMSRKQRQAHNPSTRASRSFPPLLLIGGIALIAVAILALVWIALSPNRSAGGTPQLQVSAERLDLGKQIFDRPVRASFEIQNAGSGTLTLQVPRVPTVLEGC